MTLEQYTITSALTLIGSFTTGSLLTALLTRRKTKSETRLAEAETRLTQIETYSKMIEDFRRQLEFQAGVLTAQGATINDQAIRITKLQESERRYLKIIENHQLTERELRKVIETMKLQIQALQQKYNEQN